MVKAREARLARMRVNRMLFVGGIQVMLFLLERADWVDRSIDGSDRDTSWLR
jgi:hypothetical protein